MSVYYIKLRVCFGAGNLGDDYLAVTSQDKVLPVLLQIAFCYNEFSEFNHVCSIALHMASATSRVVGLPPRSGVTDPDCMVATIAFITTSAASGNPRCSSIMLPHQIWPIGFATPFPAMSGAEPCTGSNMDG